MTMTNPDRFATAPAGLRDRAPFAPQPGSEEERRNPAEAGALLIECLVYIAVVMVLVGLMLAAFYRAFKHSERLRRASGQIIQTLQVGEQWRAEIRSATQPPRRQTEDGRETLHLPQPTGEVAYAFFDKTVWRRVGANQPWQPILDKVKSAAFQPQTRSRVQAWRWEVELDVTNRQARLKPMFTFQAVPGFKLTP